MRMDGTVTTLTTFLVAELPLTCSRGEVVSGESGPAAGLGSGDSGACAPLAGPSGSSQPLWGASPPSPSPEGWSHLLEAALRSGRESGSEPRPSAAGSLWIWPPFCCAALAKKQGLDPHPLSPAGPQSGRRQTLFSGREGARTLRHT